MSFRYLKAFLASVILLLPSALSVTASGQTRVKAVTLKVKIISATDGQPVTGASCLVTDYGIFDIADQDGNVSLEKVPAGKAEILIQILGFEDYKETLNIQRDSSLTIRILESSLTLEQVVVTAKSSAAGSSTSSSIGRMAIDHLQATTAWKYNTNILPQQSGYELTL